MSLLGDKELQNVCTSSSSSCLLELVGSRRSWGREFGVIQPSDFAEYSSVCTIWTIYWSLWWKILTSKQALDIILDSSLTVCYTQRSLGYDIRCHFLNYTVLVCLPSLLTFLWFISTNGTDICLKTQAVQDTAVSMAVTNSCSFDCPPTSHPAPQLLFLSLLLHCTTTPRQKHHLREDYLVPSKGETLHGSLTPKYGIHHLLCPLSLPRMSYHVSTW